LKTSENVSIEKREFTVDQSIIKYLVTHQAGTPTKALMELIMNSVDAGATKIEITLTREGHFSVKDNGSGFESKQDIIDLFERFGTPHTGEEDERKGTVYGRFRMGRGQIMAFAECSWRSSEYRMDVNIEKHGLGYNLNSGLEPFEGCEVSGTFFKDVEEIMVYDIEEAVRYVDTDIFINGKKISFSPSEQDWDYECDLFYYKDTRDSYHLALYNQGVFVSRYPVRQVGYGGVLVSKKRMNVNFARNDIIERDCDVWKEAKSYLRALAVEKELAKAKGKKIPKNKRYFFLNLLRTGNVSPIDFIEYAILEDADGKRLSLLDLFSNGTEIVCLSDKKGSSTASYLNMQKGVTIFAPELYGDLGLDSFSDLLAIFNWRWDEDYGAVMEDAYERIGERAESFYDWIEFGITEYWDIGSLSKEFPREIKVFNKKELTRDENIAMRHIKKLNVVLHKHLIGYYLSQVLDGRAKEIGYNSAKEAKSDLPSYEYLEVVYEIAMLRLSSILGSSTGLREIYVGDSYGGAEAWTDGENYIVIDRTLLETVVDNACPNKMFYLATVLLHEYCHLESNIDNNVHGVEFYERYHNLMSSELYSDKGIKSNRTLHGAVMQITRSYALEKIFESNGDFGVSEPNNKALGLPSASELVFVEKSLPMFAIDPMYIPKDISEMLENGDLSKDDWHYRTSMDELYVNYLYALVSKYDIKKPIELHLELGAGEEDPSIGKVVFVSDRWYATKQQKALKAKHFFVVPSKYIPKMDAPIADVFRLLEEFRHHVKVFKNNEFFLEVLFTPTLSDNISKNGEDAEFFREIIETAWRLVSEIMLYGDVSTSYLLDDTFVPEEVFKKSVKTAIKNSYRLLEHFPKPLVSALKKGKSVEEFTTKEKEALQIAIENDRIWGDTAENVLCYTTQIRIKRVVLLEGVMEYYFGDKKKTNLSKGRKDGKKKDN